MRLCPDLKGQSSLELLIILAVGLIVLGLVISSSQQRLNTSQQALAFSQARSSANALAQAADAVYFEGEGSKREVLFTIPVGAIGTFLSQHSIAIRVATENGQSDASASTQSEMCANSALPSAPGTYTITVESLEGCVALGTGGSLTVSRTLISESAHPGDSFLRTVKYSNLGASPIQVDLELDFNSPDAIIEMVNPADNLFTLNSLEERDVVLNFTFLQSALGSYSGALYANGTDGTNLTTGIFLEVFGLTCGEQACSGGASNVSMIEIKTYSSNTYSQLKDIFDPPEGILIQGGNWDPNSGLTLDVRDPTDSFSLSGYPKSLAANSSGGFNDTLVSGGLAGLNGYLVRASGLSGGSPEIRTANFDILSCN
ncbi:MAG TPA: hypothetical protein VJI13_02345 [Candidatus Norongarragalinales archaeon]|nr:hypothetical protein [Candidatus Norongarragalinales archaeon]